MKEKSFIYININYGKIEMLVVISPAKKLDENCDNNIINKFTVPPYLKFKKIVKALEATRACQLIAIRFQD